MVYHAMAQIRGRQWQLHRLKVILIAQLFDFGASYENTPHHVAVLVALNLSLQHAPVSVVPTHPHFTKLPVSQFLN